tara:strand:+ start:236 stop:577 length:342 start_codon:yes stop_codon:yes gene_type:complete
MDTLGLKDNIDLKFALDIMEEEILKMDPDFFKRQEPPQPSNLPIGFEQALIAPTAPPVEEVPTIEQEPQVQPVSPVPPPPTPQNRPQSRSVDPIGGLQSPSAERDERADALFE